MRDRSDLPLFDWADTRSATILAFPLARRTGKIRDVARKLASKTTEAHASHYVGQVSDALGKHLSRFNVSDDEIRKHLSAFWAQVSSEEARLHRRSNGNDPRGAA